MYSNELKRKYEAVASKLLLKEKELENLSVDFQQRFKHNEVETMLPLVTDNFL